jgi:hypothetical protein
MDHDNMYHYFYLYVPSFDWSLLFSMFHIVIKTNFKLSPSATMEDLLSYDLGSAHGSGWTSNVIGNLALFFVLRTVLTLFSISLPIPGGMYVPLLVMGGAFGRIFGEIMRLMFPAGFMDTSPINPGGYALVGAVALTGSVTHAFSTCFIVADITGIVFHLPNLITAFISIRLSMSVMTSIYDSVIKLRKWDVLLEPNTDRESIVVKDVMTKMGERDCLAEQCSIEEAHYFLKDDSLMQIPIVYSKRSMVLTGYITRASLQKEVDDFIESNKRMERTQIPPFLPYNVITQPFLLTESTPMLNAHVLFSSMKLEKTFVIRNGRLVGCLFKRDISTMGGGKNSSLGRFITHMKHVNSWGVLTGRKPDDKLPEEIPEMLVIKNKQSKN